MGWDYFPGKSLEAGINRILDTLTFTNGETHHKLEMHKQIGRVIYCVSSVVGDLHNVHAMRYASVILCENETQSFMPTGKWIYKVMNECEHPFRYDMPKELFDTLTPTTSVFAKRWRNEVSRKLGIEQE